MRIYVPATLDELDPAIVAAGGARWDLPARRVHAVTAALAASLPDDDAEAHEYAAFLDAADGSLALVAARPGVPPLRVVVSVEVDDAVVAAVGPAAGGADASPSAVDVEAVPGVAIVAVHVDEPEAADDVRAVLAAADEENDADDVAERGATSSDALDDALQRVADRDLLWYDPTELRDIPHP